MFRQVLALVTIALLDVVGCSTPSPSVTAEPRAVIEPVPAARLFEIGAHHDARSTAVAHSPVPAARALVRATLNPEQLALLWPLEGGFGAVLERGDIATRGTARKVRRSKHPGDFTLEKEVAESAVGRFEHLRGRVLDLYGSRGVACAATVIGFRAVGGFTMWDEHEPADSVWQALPERYLVAVVEPADRKCEPLWARAHDLPSPTVFEARTLTPTETRRAARALGQTAVARALQQSYAEHRKEGREPHGPTSWDALEPREWRAVAFEHPTRTSSYLSAELAAGEGCGDFGGYALGFFESRDRALVDVTGNGAPELPERPLFGLVPASVVVLEPNGPVYFIHPNALYADEGAGVVPVMTAGRTGTTCGC